VHAKGRTNQDGLAKAWLEAKVWAYPTWFTETSCISAMEAQAAGAVPVTTRLAALAETVRSGTLLDLPQDERYRQEFVDNVVSYLTDEKRRQTQVRAGREHAERLSWAGLARDWSKMFDETIEQVKVNPIHGFVP
jgi:glycosyltransferase involved in cell wall biosynthesis